MTGVIGQYLLMAYTTCHACDLLVQLFVAGTNGKNV